MCFLWNHWETADSKSKDLSEEPMRVNTCTWEPCEKPCSQSNATSSWLWLCNEEHPRSQIYLKCMEPCYSLTHANDNSTNMHCRKEDIYPKLLRDQHTMFGPRITWSCMLGCEPQLLHFQSISLLTSWGIRRRPIKFLAVLPCGWFLPSAWPSPAHCGQLESKTTSARFFSLLLSSLLPNK